MGALLQKTQRGQRARMRFDVSCASHLCPARCCSRSRPLSRILPSSSPRPQAPISHVHGKPDASDAGGRRLGERRRRGRGAPLSSDMMCQLCLWVSSSCPGADLRRGLINAAICNVLKTLLVEKRACRCTKGLAALRLETVFVDKFRINTSTMRLCFLARSRA